MRAIDSDRMGVVLSHAVTNNIGTGRETIFPKTMEMAASEDVLLFSLREVSHPEIMEK